MYHNNHYYNYKYNYNYNNFPQKVAILAKVEILLYNYLHFNNIFNKQKSQKCLNKLFSRI